MNKKTMAYLAICGIGASLGALALAQDTYSSLNGPPVPADTVPMVEAVGGAVGSQQTYRRGDSVQPRITRASVVTTDGSGNWSVSWASPVPGSQAVTALLPINAGTQPASCNVTTSTVNGASGKCWVAQSTLLNLGIITAGLTLTPFNPASGLQVQVVALPVSQ